MLSSKYLWFFLVLCFVTTGIEAQELDDVFGSIEQEEVMPLLPKKMLFTQRFLWGEKGVLRQTKLAPLTPMQRSREIELRRKMLIAHQALGYVTLASMIAQGIIGGKLYNGDNSLKDAHETMAAVVNIGYFTGAGLSLFAPPPLINRTEKGLSSARAHKWLASIHFSAMVATNLLAESTDDSRTAKDLHRIAAYTAFGSFATATLVLTF